MHDLARLSFISRRSAANDVKSFDEELDTITEQSRRNNKALNLTGALLFSKGYFCQVLEGEREAVEAMFETIQMDNRHSDVFVLEFEPTQFRRFTDWARTFVDTDRQQPLFPGWSTPALDALVMRKTGWNLVHMIEHLVSTQPNVDERLTHSHYEIYKDD